MPDTKVGAGDTVNTYHIQGHKFRGGDKHVNKEEQVISTGHRPTLIVCVCVSVSVCECVRSTPASEFREGFSEEEILELTPECCEGATC